VLAADVSQEMLDYLDKRTQAEGLTNVTLKKVDKDDPLLPAGGIDTILMVDTLHYVKNRGEYAKKLKAALAPGGRLVIIDYIPKSWEERPWGPPPEQHMSREMVDAEMAEGGLKQTKVYDFLPEQYFVVYGGE
jgi:cyclopropane fatty-acyl-phospholipid synthase-like methyltransferase